MDTFNADERAAKNMYLLLQDSPRTKSKQIVSKKVGVVVNELPQGWLYGAGPNRFRLTVLCSARGVGVDLSRRHARADVSVSYHKKNKQKPLRRLQNNTPFMS